MLINDATLYMFQWVSRNNLYQFIVILFSGLSMGIRFRIQYTDDFIKKGMAIMNELRLN